MLARRRLLLALGLLASAGSCNEEPKLERPAPAVRCGAPVAWLLAPPRNNTATLLADAGFDVRALPLDRSPAELDGAIVFATDVAELPEYAAYLERYADDLLDFVAPGNVLVQLPQRSEIDAQPAVVPPATDAHRVQTSGERMQVIASDSPLLSGLAIEGGRLAWRGRAVSDAFVDHEGFEVVLAGYGDGRMAGLLEAAHGRGRVVLSAVAFDEPDPAGADTAVSRRFFGNLASHTAEVCEGAAPPVRREPPPPVREFEPGASVLVALPDTRVYAAHRPDVFSAQTRWIRSRAGELDIRYVFHLGDVVDASTPTQWARARAALAELDGVVPYAVAPGSHDYGPSGVASTRDTVLHEWLAYPDDTSSEGFGGALDPGRLDNTYHLFDAGGHGFIALVLEWRPRDEVVAWANRVMERHADRLGVLVTHAYLDGDERRQEPDDPSPREAGDQRGQPKPDGVNDGEELWQRLVRRHRFVMTLSGDVVGDGAGYLVSTNDLGGEVHQMSSNFQMREDGGEGYLRIIELLPDGRTVRVRTYSPVLDVWLAGAEHNLVFELDLDGPERRPA